MTRHHGYLPTLALPSIAGALARRWARHFSALGERMDTRPLPHHHRLGSWQLMLVLPRAASRDDDVDRQSWRGSAID